MEGRLRDVHVNVTLSLVIPVVFLVCLHILDRSWRLTRGWMQNSCKDRLTSQRKDTDEQRQNQVCEQARQGKARSGR